MASILSPLHTAQLPSSPPPADRNSRLIRRTSLSQGPNSQPPHDRLTRRSSNRYSWSTASNTSPVSASSPTSAQDTASSPPRKFRLPVRVSTEQTSFAPSSSSPESRRRSVSVASETKRRSRSLYLQQLEEDKITDSKASPKLSPKESSSLKSPPPPAYEKTPAASDSSKKAAPTPSPTKAEPKRPSPTPKAQEPAPPAYEKPPSQPVKEREPAPTPVPQQNTIANTRKMSSTASSPDQKTAMTGNPAMQNRGIDFSLASGNNKLEAQHGNGLPLPGLSGKANGPAGNLLRGPVDDEGNLKAAALTVGIKLDLEAEVHLSARVRGDILVGLY